MRRAATPALSTLSCFVRMHGACMFMHALHLAMLRRIQREYFKKQEAEGSVVAKPPTPQTMGKSALEAVGVPGHVTQVLKDPEQSIALTTSKNMWTSNPGYIVRDGARMASTTHKDFVYDQEEVRAAGLGERWGQHACSMQQLQQ